MTLILIAKYGPFDYVVSSATAAVGAAAALTRLWRPRREWEPSDIELPRAPERVGLVVSTAMIVLLWSVTIDGKHHHAAVVALIASAASCVVGLVLYLGLVSTMTYEREVFENGRFLKQKVIGGFRLTKAAKQALKEGRVRSSLLAGMANEPNNVWTRPSRALAKVCFVLAYLLFVPAGTIAIAATGIVIAGST